MANLIEGAGGGEGGKGGCKQAELTARGGAYCPPVHIPLIDNIL